MAAASDRLRGESIFPEKAKIDIFKYIQIIYNPMRRHSSLGNISPVGYER